jgi:hypothetical protein
MPRRLSHAHDGAARATMDDFGPAWPQKTDTSRVASSTSRCADTNVLGAPLCLASFFALFVRRGDPSQAAAEGRRQTARPPPRSSRSPSASGRTVQPIARFIRVTFNTRRRRTSPAETAGRVVATPVGRARRSRRRRAREARRSNRSEPRKPKPTRRRSKRGWRSARKTATSQEGAGSRERRPLSPPARFGHQSPAVSSLRSEYDQRRRSQAARQQYESAKNAAERNQALRGRGRA